MPHAVCRVLRAGLAPAAYDYLPFFYSRVFSLAWVFYGKNDGAEVHFGDFEAGEHSPTNERK